MAALTHTDVEILLLRIDSCTSYEELLNIGAEIAELYASDEAQRSANLDYIEQLHHAYEERKATVEVGAKR